MSGHQQAQFWALSYWWAVVCLPADGQGSEFEFAQVLSVYRECFIPSFHCLEESLGQFNTAWYKPMG